MTFTLKFYTMKNKVQKFFIPATLLLLLVLGLNACREDGTAPEFFTRIILHIEGSNGFSKDFTWTDVQGDGIPDSIDTIVLEKTSTYTCTLKAFDDTVSPPEDKGAEILAENTAHLLVYTTVGPDLAIVATDADDNGEPFRFNTQWQSGGVSHGTVNVRLIHEPDKSAGNPESTGIARSYILKE